MTSSRDEYIKHYREKNKESLKQKGREYYQKNKERIKEYVALNKDKIAERQKKYRQDNKKKTQHYFRKLYYNLSEEQYSNLLSIQQECCKICGIHEKELKKSLVVDHCHVTGKVRGLLCTHCNFILGHAKDNISTLEKAVLYLKETSNAPKH